MRKVIVGLIAITALAVGGTARAQSGHFLTGGGNAVTCMDIGTQVSCTGKCAGLGGTTFRIEVDATGLASVECTNPGENVAPGQDTTIEGAGETGNLPTPRNGQFRFSVSTIPPIVPDYPTCPNPQWSADVIDVAFTTATVSLYENGVLSDQVTVPVN